MACLGGWRGVLRCIDTTDVALGIGSMCKVEKESSICSLLGSDMVVGTRKE